jgi:hypothetical protein
MFLPLDWSYPETPSITTHILNLAECDEKARGEWLRALDAIEALHPKAVVAGHGVLGPDSSPRHVEETRAYLRDFNQVVAKTSTAINLYEKMLALHPRPRESRLALGNREGSERKCSSIRIGARMTGNAEVGAVAHGNHGSVSAAVIEMGRTRAALMDMASLRERVGLGPQHRFRLVGVGLSNFCDPEDASAQPALLANNKPV